MKTNYLITGGAGFIGANLADHYLAGGHCVTIFDNFSRPGTQLNLQWLRERYGEGLKVIRGDVRKPDEQLRVAIDAAQVVFHLAAQVAVTTSVIHPREDFEINALGTFNLLECVRQSASRPVVVYSSTNKVYGKMSDLEVVERGGRYTYSGVTGIPESRPLDFYSPYGCSKGTGDQYVVDYARIYGLKTIVFRQSCIYGRRQFGMEDQGWVAWFAIRASQNLPVTIYGDGMQVRDILHVDDLVAGYDAAVAAIDCTAGKAYNIGGGPENTLSLLELVDCLEGLFGRKLSYSFEDWRPGDQLIFVSDISRARADFGWRPRITVKEGVAALANWIRDNPQLFPVPGALAAAGGAK